MIEWLKDNFIGIITLLFGSVVAWVTLKNRVDEGNRILTEVRKNLEAIDKKLDADSKAINDKIDRGLQSISDKFDRDLSAIDEKIDAVNLVIAAWKEIDRSNAEKFTRMNDEILSNRDRIHKLIDNYIAPMQVELRLLKKGVKLTPLDE